VTEPSIDKVRKILVVIEQGMLEKAREPLGNRMDRNVEKGRMEQEEVNAAFDRMSFTTDLVNVASEADFVIETAVETAASEVMKRRMGELAEPYQKEEAGRYEKLATALTVAGAAITALTGRKRGPAALGGALTLGGAAAKRWSVFRAGFQSARDPEYTIKPQLERLARRPPGQRRTETFGDNASAT
jgi:hypothetical protein